QVIVGRLHVEVVVPHGEAAIADVRAAARLPEVVPELAAVAGVDRPGIVGHGEVEGAVDLEHGGFDGAAAGREIAGAFAAGDDGRPTSAESAAAAATPTAAGVTRTGSHARRPSEREVLDVGLIDLVERA